MEADIIAEGFRQAESMHGVRYMKVMGDGDSAVMSTIQDTVSWGPYATKIECANHAVKSYHSRLEKITEDYPMYKRKLTKKIIKRLKIRARCAIKMHASTGNYKQLQADFRNGPYHVYNHHDHCSTTFCKVAQNKRQCLTSSDVSASTASTATINSLSQPSSSNVTVNSSSQPSSSNVTVNSSSQPSTSPPESETLLDQVAHVVAQDCHTEEENSEEHESRQADPSQNITEIPNDLLFKILRAGDCLVAMAPQLITNSTSNLAECFVSIRAKFDGGKFYNRVQKGSFQHRCQGAGLQWQLGLEWHTTAFEKVTNEKAGPILQAHVAHAKVKRQTDKNRQQQHPYKHARMASKHTDTHTNATREADQAYGPSAIQPDISREQLDLLCASYLKGLHVTPEEATNIEEATRQQADDSTGLWYEVRKPRLTASRFGEVAKRRDTTPVARLVRSLLYERVRETKAMRYGRDNEPVARAAYTASMQRNGHPHLQTLQSGFVIDPANSWLGCSPDNVVCDLDCETAPGLAEYKCPASALEMTPTEATALMEKVIRSYKNLIRIMFSYKIWPFLIRSESLVTSQ